MGRDYDQIRKQLGLNIKALRRQKKLSQEELAHSTGLDRTYISQVERGVGNPSLLVLCKLAAIFEIDVIELMSDN
ncbi:helix-turn-helix domain-containing protein [Pseudoduganella sp. S-14]|uniref:helix-turn-helix domain-containing protein n=1 Tax=Pseudoduganella sp. S-14 TaxID=3404065 RepID=UPI003CF6C1A8